MIPAGWECTSYPKSRTGVVSVSGQNGQLPTVAMEKLTIYENVWSVLMIG